MKLKKTKGELLWAVFKSISLTLVIIYAAVAFYTVANRQVTALADTAWLSNKQDEILFVDTSMGIWIEDGTETEFTYEAKNGYVLCHIDETLLFELVEIEDNRLFAVNTNNIYYNEAYL